MLRRYAEQVALLVVGAFFLLGAAVSLVSLRVKAPELDEEPFAAIGIRAEGVEPAAGRGFAVGLHVRFRGCDEPIRGWLAVNGTSAFWQDHRAEVRPRTVLKFALPGEDTTVAGAVVSDDPFDLAVPSLLPYSEDNRHIASARVVDSEPVAGWLSGRVEVDDWAKHMAPVVLTFQADWTRERSRGSCYLRLPALTSGDTVPAAYAAEHLSAHSVGPRTGLSTYFDGERVPYRPTWELSAGTTTLELGEARLEADVSLPAPDDSVGGSPATLCIAEALKVAPVDDRDAARRADLVLPPGRDEVGALSQTYIGEDFDDCSSFAVVTQGGTFYDRDFVLLIAGGALSLGATILFEAFLRRRRNEYTVIEVPGRPRPFLALIALFALLRRGRR